MKKNTYYAISASMFLLALFIFALHQEYIIINPRKTFFVGKVENTATKKKISLYFFKDKWQQDPVQLLLSENNAHNAQMLINRWLENAFDEGIIKKKITLQTIFITCDHELVISFDRSLFSKESSVFDKWMLIESILKSLKETIPIVKKVRFLVHYQPFIDPHLNFENGWPIEGFIY